MSMTPALRELLERHPAPWVCEDGANIFDARGAYVNDWYGCEVFVGDGMFANLAEVFVELVNAAAAEVGR